MTDQPTPDEATTAAPAAQPVEPAAPEPVASAPDELDDGPTANEYTVAFSPRNVAVGLAIVAGLVGLVVRRRRRARATDACPSSRRSRPPPRSPRRTPSWPARPPTPRSRRSPAAPTSWSGSPARSARRRAAMVDLSQARRAPGNLRRRGSGGARGAHHVHRDPPIGRLPRAPAGPGRGGGHDRRRPDPEPGHDRRQHRQRVAGRGHAAGPARPRCRGRRRRGPRRADDPGRRLLGRVSADGPRARRADPASPDSGRRRPRGAVPEDRDAPGPGDQQGRARAGLAGGGGSGRAGRAGRAWSDVRLALGSVADRPIRARATEAILEGTAPTPETADAAAEALAAEIHPIDDVRSTADYRRAVAARALHRMIRDAGGW